MNNPIVQIMAVWINTNSSSLVETRLRDFLDELVQVLNLTVIMPTIGVKLPIKGNYKDFRGKRPNPEDFGYSFVTLIAESHIAIHTWPGFNKAFLDIVSCKEFGEEKVKKVIRKYFPNSKITHSALKMV